MSSVLLHHQKDGKRLELVQVLFRHGERTPLQFEFSIIPYVPASAYEPYGFGQLTNTGRMQAYELGSILRKRYQNYLSDAYNAEDLYAYSSDSDRAIMTLQLVLAGLYPPTSAFQWNPTLNWSPIPYRCTPAQFDVLFKLVFGRTFEELYRRETDHLVRDKNANEYTDVIAILEDKFGLHIAPDERGDVLTDVYNVFHSHERMGIPLPEWCTRDVLSRLKDYFIFSVKCLSHTQQMKRLSAGPLVKTFVDNMNVNETMLNPRKMYLYSGHDLNIGAIVNALEIKNFEYPDYASAIVLEKLRDVDNRVYVRLIGRRGAGEEFQTLKFGNCDEFCPIEKFLSIVRDVIPSDEEMHHLENEFKGSVTNDVFLNDPCVKKRQ